MVEIGIHYPTPSPHPDFWVTGGDTFSTRPLRSTPRLVRFWIASGNSHQLDPSNVSSLVWWMVRQGWDWNSLSTTVTTPWLFSHGWWKFWSGSPLVSHPDHNGLDWFKQFTSAWPFQCLIISLMNGYTRLRLEFIVHNHHNTLTFQSRVVKILV